MRRNWAATVLVVSVSVLCAPALAGSARPPVMRSALSPGPLSMTVDPIRPFVSPDAGHRSINAPGSLPEADKHSGVEHLLHQPLSLHHQKQAFARERVRVGHKLGRLQLGGMALRRVRPGQLGRPTENVGGQDIHVRAGASFRLAPHCDLTSEVLYIQPAVQSLYVRRARSPLQAGVGTRISTSKASFSFSFGAGMAEWGRALQPGFFMFLGPGSP